jgi:5'-3' exonuclease
MGKNKIIIDGDSLTFYSSKDTIQESIENLELRLSEIFEHTQAKSYLIFLSDGKYFRHRIYEQYKAARKIYKEKNKNYSSVLKQFLITDYNAIIIRQVEADDMVAYTKNLFPDSIICSPDKDVLHQIAGTHYDYRIRKTINKNGEEILQKGEWVNTSKVDAYYFIWLQSLMGDSVDGITGIPGVGIKRAEKILKGIDPENYPSAVLKQYIDYYGVNDGIHQFNLMYSLIYLLRTDSDFASVGLVPPRLFTDDDFTKLKSEDVASEWSNM